MQLADKEWCLELWHGPTFAFKDVALQLVGNLFEYFLQRRNAAKPSGAPRDRITVLGATSGDTGSAAIAGLRSKADIDIFILHPKGRVSPIQEAQMTTVLDANVHNVAVEGTFDDCQDIVKVCFSDKAFNDAYRLGAVNSINFARILAQIVYYFSAYFQLQKQLSSSSSAPPEIQFVVPTGNFGDILAGYYAKRLGLPIKNLAIATNENDILQRFWESGAYEKNSSAPTTSLAPQVETAQGSSDGAQTVIGGVKATLSPAMDILVSSNFERLLWYLVYETSSASGSEEDRAQEAGAQIAQWMKSLKEEGKFQVSEERLALARRDFAAERVSDEETKTTILKYFSSPPSEAHRKSYLIDPHTAVGMHAANKLLTSGTGVSPSTHQIILSTAHPAKFSEAVVSSLESAGASFDFERDVLPPEMHGLLEKERRVIEVKSGSSGFESLLAGTKKVVEDTVKANQQRPSGQATESI